MNDVREATADLLAEKPHLEAALRDVLAVDRETTEWTFNDVPIDSGPFGELVSRDIVVKTDGGDGYRVADPTAVRSVLDGEPTPDADEDGDRTTSPLSLVSLPSISARAAGALASVLALLVFMRTYIFWSVFRSDDIVLSSNDPYYYRYWTETLAGEATGIFDFSIIAGLPELVERGEPLLVAVLWWVSNALGGGPKVVGSVLAWYPVAMGVVAGILVYLFATRLTNDRRVGLAAVAVLAVIPAHAYRTGLGFADHHAFDYPWLALSALGLVWLATDVGETKSLSLSPFQRAETWKGVIALGIGIAGQTLAWEAGPLLAIPIGLYVAFKVLSDMQSGRSPLASNAPVALGTAVGAVLTLTAHVAFGWHETFVALAPSVLFVGVLGVVILAEGFSRTEFPPFVFASVEIAGFLSGFAALQVFLPIMAKEVDARIAVLLSSRGVAETQSMLGGALGFLLGPPLILGFAWVIAIPYLVWLTWLVYDCDQPKWLVAAAYTWYCTLLASLQVRFAGELSLFVAALAGLGFIHLASKVDILAPPVSFRDDQSERLNGESKSIPSISVPDRSTVTTLTILFLLVASAGVVQTGVKHEQVRIEDSTYATTKWIDSYAADRGWEYPENYVFSDWSRNRVFNYFVNGQSRSYEYAQRNYELFLSSNDSEAWYEQLRSEGRFVVTKDISLNGQPRKDTNYWRLHEEFGSRTSAADGVAHYRAMFSTENGERKVFTLVPGATITGTVGSNESVALSKRVRIEGARFTYRRTARAAVNGTYAVTVPYPGTYTVGNETVTVSESAVENGKNIRA